MTPKQIATARALVALGLAKPNPWDLSDLLLATLNRGRRIEAEHVGLSGYDSETRIMWTVVATDTGPELLPALDDWALLGWLIAELERVTGDVCDITEIGYELGMSDDYPKNWQVHVDKCTPVCAPTRIEALTAALKAAKEAGK